MSFRQMTDSEKVLVLDFDGTCTVPLAFDDEALTKAYQNALAEFTRRAPEWVAQAYEAAARAIAADPDRHGWTIGGRIVAPALVDPFIKAQVCCEQVLRRLGENPKDWNERLAELYAENYAKHQRPLREALWETFLPLKKRGIPFYVVSNADTQKVRERLKALGEDAIDVGTQVIGFAKKFDVTDTPECVPPRLYFPGLERPIWLRKGHYFDVLREILRQHRLCWKDMTVVGDIAELDLALPVHLGARGLLMLGPNTPGYERRWASAHHLVHTIRDLREILTQ